MEPDAKLVEAARLLLSRLAQESVKGPTMAELWLKYWLAQGQHLRSSVRTAISWKMVRGITGSDGVALEDRDAMKVDTDVVEELRASRSEWWDVNVDGLKLRFEIACYDRWTGRWRLRFSSKTPNRAAVLLAHRVGQNAREVTVKRCAPAKKQRELDLEKRAAGPKRVTVEDCS